MIRVRKARRKFRNARLAAGARRMSRPVKRVKRNPEHDMQHQEWSEGYSAAANGLARRSPYRTMTRANAQWLKGYDAAKKDIKQRDNKWFPSSERYRNWKRSRAKRNPLFKKKRKKRVKGKLSPYKRGVLAGASAKKYGYTTGSNPYRANSNSYFKWQQGFEHGLKKGLPKKKRRKRTKKTKVTVTQRNTRRTNWPYVVVAVTESGRKYYYTGSTLNTDVNTAKLYRDVEEARNAARYLIKHVPDDIYNVTVERYMSHG